jgi:Flp pilus assembly protein TadG
LGRFLADKRGVSAVEFAMLLPLMVTLYLGGAEVSQAIAVDRKMTLVARTLADLTAQTTSVSNTDMDNIKAAATAVIAPFDNTKLAITISSIIVDAQKVAKIKWSDNRNGTVRNAGDVVSVPDTLKESSTYPIYLVWAESKYVYTPTVGYVITGPMNLTDKIYMRPRLSDCVLRENIQTTC